MVWLIWGQRCSAWLLSRCHSEVWVETGIFAMGPSWRAGGDLPRSRRGVAARRRRICGQQDHDHLFPICDHLVRRGTSGADLPGARARTAHRDVLRAQIILAAADGRTNAAIAANLGLHVDTVRKWRRRFCTERLAGLADRPGPAATPVQRRPGRGGEGVGL